MARNRRLTGFSDLEREFELDMESEPPEEEAFETDLDEEFEADLDEEYGEEESGEDLDQEFEVLAEALEQDADPREMEFADRFYELGQRQYESEFEVDRALSGVLNEMEREYFLGGLAKRLKRSKLVRGLVRKGLNFAQQRFPALKAVTQLARGNLKGALMPLAKTALGTVVPGGPAALSVLKGLGFETAEDAAQNRVGWQNYTRMAREAYENLADNVTIRVDEPREASQLAASAFQQAVGQAQQRTQALASQAGVGTGARGRGGRVIRVRLRPGQKLLVTRG